MPPRRAWRRAARLRSGTPGASSRGWGTERPGLAATGAQPRPQDVGGLLGEGGAALLAALAGAAHVCARAKGDVFAAQPGELGDAQPGLDGEQHQGMVTLTCPGCAVWTGQQCLDLTAGEVGDHGGVVALLWDG